MKNSKGRNPLANLALISQVGLSMFIPIIGCLLLGKYLDAKFSTGNLLLITFTILGVLSAFRNLFVIGMKSTRNDKNESDKNK